MLKNMCKAHSYHHSQPLQNMKCFRNLFHPWRTQLHSWTHTLTTGNQTKASHNIIKKVKIKEDLEEKVIKQQLLVEDTSTTPLTTNSTSRALANHRIQHGFHIVTLKACSRVTPSMIKCYQVFQNKS